MVARERLSGETLRGVVGRDVFLYYVHYVSFKYRFGSSGVNILIWQIMGVHF